MKRAIIIGGGPAGLTAAYELTKRSDIKPIVIEKDDILGGISRTVNYKGNRIDIGGHRFFSKSDTVMNWWADIMPQENEQQNATNSDNVMLVRNRISRIYFLRKFFDYPISLSIETIRRLGFVRLMKIGFSYIYIRLVPIRNEKSLEDFYTNRFGRQLYLTFFKDYTEKVWGTKCSDISPEWGSQRVKGLSISKAIAHAVKQIFTSNKDITQKGTETSLIEKFLYPKLGPGQLWEYVGERITEGGGEIIRNDKVVKILTQCDRVTGVVTSSGVTIEGDYIISTMPIRELTKAIDDDVPQEVSEISNGLIYRDFMTVGLLLKRMNMPDKLQKCHPDTWIYIQEREVKLGRVQIFNNWSPYMVADKDNVWVGLEYFVNEGDDMWTMPDAEFAELGISEMESIDMICREDVIDSTVIRIEKAYPAYFGTYDQIDKVKDYVDKFENLYLVGRNGMHKYNNQDHSMLTAIAAVENIISGVSDKSNIWSINTESEYHESKS